MPSCARPRARHLHDLCPARRPERSSVQRHVRRWRRALVVHTFGTNRAPPTWRSAPHSRPANPPRTPWCPVPDFSTAPRRSPPPIRRARVLALIGQIPSRGIGKGHGLLHEIPDQIGILRRLTKWAERVDTPQHGTDIITRAFQALGIGSAAAGRRGAPPDMLAARAEVEMSSPCPSMAIRRSTRTRSSAPPVCWHSGLSGDLRRRRRVRCRRRCARLPSASVPVVSYRRGRARARRSPPARSHAAGRPCAVGEGRCRARGRHAAAASTRELGH